jgi:hypothetical protein
LTMERLDYICLASGDSIECRGAPSELGLAAK